MPMTERPILFSGPMVQAILAGRKTQTRRIIKPQPFPVGGPFYRPSASTAPRTWHSVSAAGYIVNIQTSRWAEGDTLWVRETWAQNANQLSDTRMDRSFVYRADGGVRALDNGDPKPWRPSIHMPRWASRITLLITEVRVERLHAITDADAVAEGAGLYVPGHGFITEAELRADPGYSNFLAPRMGFEVIWNSINGDKSWDANPWVWAVRFERVAP